MPDIIVIGGGAAGIMAAYGGAESGKDVLIIEKNKMLGRKLRITGKGRCNVTNIAETREMMQFVPKNSKFLYSALKSFSNSDLMNLIESKGVALKVERGGRVFPESDKASDIAEALEKLIKLPNVRVEYCDSVSAFITENGNICGVKTSKGKTHLAKSVILCTGGKSYPLTGSDGFGYTLAKSVGHSITPVKPALIPLVTKEEWASRLQGLSLKNVSVILRENGKKIFEDFGEMLFTHFGVSGPVILSASCHIEDIDNKEYHIEIDLKPALDSDKLDERILRDFAENSNKNFENSIGGLLPQKLIPVIIELSGIDKYKKVNSVTKDERRKFKNLLKCLKLKVTGFRPIDEAIITDGGICVKEINPSTMESKLVKGLYFAGEVIDVAAYTGGYNLQIAFSTGYLAGKSAAKGEN